MSPLEAAIRAELEGRSTATAQPPTTPRFPDLGQGSRTTFTALNDPLLDSVKHVLGIASA